MDMEVTYGLNSLSFVNAVSYSLPLILNRKLGVVRLRDYLVEILANS
jgi:hypothetical protein